MNPASARFCMQADLDHARYVVERWPHQVRELRQALDRFDAGSPARNGPRVQ